ncbi:cysteine desulfurase [Pseudorhizobium endolithicum]|uniref:Cysteine desulfurase n=1 Tax=Pseudorhizobium endolithicum TaxID=1191678 RepID=A0ABM8PRQ9_9HYPH|nr:cysteine desulfurase family protein [Pseudorhizobium endolithicum]CAD7044917.1 cysteine desulfurase [Pseudorhizobium endolithicum]
MARTRVYMDWNATAPIGDPARLSMLEALQLPGNASSVHAEGRAARTALEKARRQVAALVGADPAHVIFTGSATEAANQVLTPDFRMGRSPLAIGRLYVSAIEHPAVREGGRFPLESVVQIGVTPSGVVDLDVLAAALQAHDASLGMPMVALMLVNNETGVIQPVVEAARLVHEHGGMIVVDAVQAAGRMTVDINELGADFLLLSSHKIAGPKGVGALVTRGEALMPAPLIRGGGQEKGHRSGTENFHGIIGFGAAAEAALEGLSERNAAIAALRRRLEEGMRQVTADVIIHGDAVERIANTCFFSLPGLKSETGQIAFDLEGIAISAGSACSSGKVGQSHVLSAMGFDAETGGLRISLGSTTSEADIDAALAAFEKIARRRPSAGKAA